jgi:4-amino-4-deoxy-L-arabinose transferase-like glycosyltransferase
MLIATPFVHAQWREIDTDPFLTAGLIAAWYFFVATLQRVDQDRSRSAWSWALCAYLAMGVASLAKGPFLLGIFFLFPVAAFLLWRHAGAATEGRLRTLLRLGAWWGLPLALLIGLGWNLFLDRAAVTQGQGQASESLRRFLGGVDHNKGIQMYPWLQYLLNVPHQLLPWSLFFLPLIPLAWREHRTPLRITLTALAALVIPAVILRLIGGGSPQDHWQFGLYLGIAIGLIIWTIAVSSVWVRRMSERSDQTKLLVCAVAIPFLIMGIVGSKRDSYLLPIFPFLALWAAKCWDFVLSSSEAGEPSCAGQIRAWKTVAGMMAAVVVLVPPVIALTGPLGIQAREGFSLSGEAIAVAIAMSIALAVAAAATLRDLRAGNLVRAAQQVLLMCAAGLLVHAAVLKPALDQREDRTTFYGTVSETAGSRPLVWFGGSANEAVYYCRRTVNRPLTYGQIDANFFQVPDAVMVVRDREFDNPKEPGPGLRTSVRTLRKIAYGKQNFYLVEADPHRPPTPELLKGSPPPRQDPDGDG